jgi:hypothetical protein
VGGGAARPRRDTRDGHLGVLHKKIDKNRLGFYGEPGKRPSRRHSPPAVMVNSLGLSGGLKNAGDPSSPAESFLAEPRFTAQLQQQPPRQRVHPARPTYKSRRAFALRSS